MESQKRTPYNPPSYLMWRFYKSGNHELIPVENCARGKQPLWAWWGERRYLPVQALQRSPEVAQNVKSGDAALNGRAQLKSSGSIWGAPIPVLTIRKYFPIVDKRGAFSRPVRSNCAQPMPAMAHWMGHSFPFESRGQQRGQITYFPPYLLMIWSTTGGWDRRVRQNSPAIFSDPPYQIGMEIGDLPYLKGPWFCDPPPITDGPL